jgi:hypothetical protein
MILVDRIITQLKRCETQTIALYFVVLYINPMKHEHRRKEKLSVEAVRDNIQC